MQYQYLHEVVRLLITQSDNDPRIFTSFFDKSDNLIGFNYCSTKKKFTCFSQSFEKIIGYNPRNILIKDDFISKIIHPHDKAIFIDYMFSSSEIDKSKNGVIIHQPVVYEAKCRARHLKGYWKYLIFFYINYIEVGTGFKNKIGLMANEYIQSGYDSITRSLDQINWKEISTGKTAFMYKSDSVNISKREAQVLELIGDGNIAKEIANKLNISPSTVVTHRKNLISKFKVRNTAQLIKKASQLLLI